MKKLFLTLKLLIMVSLFSTQIFAGAISNTEISYDKVYRSDKVADSYHFMLLTKGGDYYHLHTNKATSLTPNEMKSSNLIELLNKKQSWGQAFPLKGQYTKKNGKLFTKQYFDAIKVISSKKIKYLNKIFYLQ